MIVKILQFSPYVRQYAIAISASLCLFSVGLSLQWTSPVLPKLSDETNPVLSRPITDNEASWIASISFVSMLISSFFTVYFSDRFGRKYCTLLSLIPRLLCFVIAASAGTPWLIIFGRILSGVADGFQVPIVTAYISEIASKEIRGQLGSFHLISLNLGGLFIYCVGPYLDYLVLNIVVVIVCIAVFIPAIFIPESPYFLFSKRKITESKKVLVFLRGTEELADNELKEYEQLKNNDQKVALMELLKSKTVMKSIIITFLCTFLTPWCGFTAIQAYLQPILKSTGTSIAPEKSSVYVGFVQFLSSVLALFFIERLPRKTILFISLIMLTIGMIGMSTFFWYSDGGYAITSFLNALPLISIVIIFFGYNAGLGSLIMPLSAELFDGASRALGLGVAVCSASLSAFTVSKLLFTMTNSSLGHVGTFALFAAFCLILLVFIRFFVPETKGKSFSEIQAKFGKTIQELNNCDKISTVKF